MPALNNTRWEMFCIGIASGKTKVDAYLDAGFQDPNRKGANAWVLMQRPDIQARVAELVEQRHAFKANYVDNTDMDHLKALDTMADDGVIDRKWVIKELMENVKIGRETGQIAASNLALKMLGGEIGMFQERRGGNGEAPEDKPKEIKSPVSIDSINRLLAEKGYDGPPIDLTPKQTIKIANG